MELRHLRYLIAVAAEGSLSGAAAKRLHVSQPSLSRQIRDLEIEVGARLLTRGPGGVSLTPAGEAFLPHARAALDQVEAAKDGARRANQQVLVLGFLTGYEFDWLPAIMSIACEVAPGVAVKIRSESYPAIVAAVQSGEVDLGIVRLQDDAPGVEFRKIWDEPLVAIMCASHRFAGRTAITLNDLAREPLVGSARELSPAMRDVLDSYGRRLGVDLTPTLLASNHQTLLSLIASANGVGLVASSAHNLLPSSLVSRPVAGVEPELGLYLAYDPANGSEIVRHLAANFDRLTSLVRNR